MHVTCVSSRKRVDTYATMQKTPKITKSGPNLNRDVDVWVKWIALGVREGATLLKFLK